MQKNLKLLFTKGRLPASLACVILSSRYDCGFFNLRALSCFLFAGLFAIYVQELPSAKAQDVAQSDTLTLDSTIRKMLSQNGEFLAEKAEHKASKLGRYSALSSLLPTAAIRGGYNFINGYKSTTPASPGITGPGSNTRCDSSGGTQRNDSSNVFSCDDLGYDVDVTVTQPLYSRRFYNVAESFANYRGGRHRLHVRANDFILETIQSYLEVQTAVEQREYAEKNLEGIRKLFNRVKARAQVDPGQRYLLNRAQTRLSLGEEDFSKSRQLEVVARSRLARLIGEDFGDMEKSPKLEGLPESVEDSMVLARENNPALLAARAEVKSRAQATLGAWSGLVPEINLSYNYRNSRNQSGFNRTIEEHSVSIGGIYEFSLGFAPVFDALGTQQRLKSARYLRFDAERRIEEEVNNAWIEISESRRIHAQALQFLEATERERNAYRRQFSAGQRNLLDLLNIQNEFFAAQQRELSARVAKEVARYRILATIGELTARFGGL